MADIPNVKKPSSLTRRVPERMSFQHSRRAVPQATSRPGNLSGLPTLLNSERLESGHERRRRQALEKRRRPRSRVG